MTDEQLKDALKTAGSWFFLVEYETIKNWRRSKEDLINLLYLTGYDKNPGGTRARVNAILKIIESERDLDALNAVKDSRTVNADHPDASSLADCLICKHFSLPSSVPPRISGYLDDDKLVHYFVKYGDAVSDSEKIPGLRAFLSDVYDNIVSNTAYFLIDHPEDFWPCSECLPMIPVILKTDMPTRTYTEDDSHILKKIKELLNKSELKKSTTVTKEIQKILDSKRWSERILGTYHHNGYSEHDASFMDCAFRFNSGIPYIEIYYKNTVCPDEESYKALLSNCLAHEYFHFLHDWYIGPQFYVESKHRNPVIEALADFFSVAYTLVSSSFCGTSRPSYSDSLYKLAQNRYDEWLQRKDSSWPYAYAIYLYMNSYGLDDTLDLAIKEKFISVLKCSKKDMELAFNELIK